MSPSIRRPRHARWVNLPPADFGLAHHSDRARPNRVQMAEKPLGTITESGVTVRRQSCRFMAARESDVEPQPATIIGGMLGATILFDPLPVGRIGIRRDTEEVVVASDFSTFAWMMEEFVSLGVSTICVGRSAPESGLLSQMPPLLRRRIRVTNDDKELQAAALIMEQIHEEVGCRLIRGTLIFDRKIKPDLKSAVVRVQHDLYALAVGLNHEVQVAINAVKLLTALDCLRYSLRNERGRTVASQLSGVIGAYVPLRFDAPQIASGAPAEIVSIFDRLVNDESYVGFSSSVGSLIHTAGRRAALARIRSCVRRIVKSPPVQVIVDSISKLVKVGGATALPQASSLFSMFRVRALPMLVDLTDARSQTLKRWLATAGSAPPWSRAGRRLTSQTITWLSPLQSASAGEPGDAFVSMGRVGDLLESLTDYDRTRRSR